MDYETMLGLYHYCNAWHGGQWSREYRVMCRLRLTPRGQEEYLECLARPDYARAREVYVHFASAAASKPAKHPYPCESGYVTCVCCGHAVVVDNMAAEEGVTMCPDCYEEDCDPREPCACGEEGSDEDG